MATEVRKIINLEELEKNSRLVEKELKISSASIEKLLGIGASFVAAIVIALNPIVQGIANSVVSLLTATVPSLVAISWQYRKSMSSENKGEKKDTQYYRHDYDTNTLQSDLEDKLRLLSKQNFKVIFVIDELDKVNEREISATIKSLKTFFNQSFTQLVLISGEEFFKNMLKEIQSRPKEYTLFPQKIFLQRPLFNEMEDFLDKVTKNQGQAKFGEDYTMFRNYTSYASRTDFFDLYNVIRDRISYDENGNSFLDINLVDRKHVIKAELQKVLGQIYSRKRYEHISDWYKNDQLLDEMYDLEPIRKLLDIG